MTSARPGVPTPAAATQDRGQTGWLAVLVLLLVVQLIVLYAPSTPGSIGVEHLDKLVHALVFAAPTFAALAVGRKPRWAVGILALHAPVSELVQAGLLRDRDGDAWDVVADLTGIALGIGAFLVWRRLLR